MDQLVLEVLWNRLISVVNEQAAALMAGDPVRPITHEERGRFLLEYIELLQNERLGESAGFRHVAPGERPVPSGPARGHDKWVINKLRALMSATAHSGTAAGPMGGLKGDIGGKTGTAERAAGQATDSWFTAYRDNLAVAAMVEGGGHGVDAAGPASAAVLAVGNPG